MQSASQWKKEYEGNSDYVNYANLKGMKNKSPVAIKLKLIDLTINIMKKEICPSKLKKLTTLIWDISVASYEQGKGE